MTRAELRAAWILGVLLFASTIGNVILSLRVARGARPPEVASESQRDEDVPRGAALSVRERPCAEPVEATTTDAGAATAAGAPERAWIERMERSGGERARALAERHGDAARVERVVCVGWCCTFYLAGRAVTEVASELSSSAGYDWATSESFAAPRDRPEALELTLCFDRAEPGPEHVDRLAERTRMLEHARPALEACRGRPGSPGTLELGIHIGKDGKDLFLERGGDLQGTEAAACVEDAVLAAADFAPAKSSSLLQLSFQVESK